MEPSQVRGALEAAWPELESLFAANDADPIDSGLSYLEMARIARFLAEKLRAGETTAFPAFFAGVERCLLEGDDKAVELVMVGLLEDLQNGNITDFDDDSVWVPFLQPVSHRASQAVEDFWNGDADALARFRVR